MFLRKSPNGPISPSLRWRVSTLSSGQATKPMRGKTRCISSRMCTRRQYSAASAYYLHFFHRWQLIVSRKVSARPAVAQGW